MKKTATLILLFCFLQVLSVSVLTAEQLTNLGFTVSSKSPRGMEVQFNLPDFEIEDEVLGGTTYQKISVLNSGSLTDEGMPQLPTMSAMIAVPGHGSVQIEMIDTHTKMVKHIIPYPSQGNNNEANPRNIILNSAFYNGNQVYPQDIIRCSDPQVMRDFRLVTVQVQPFAWDSATRELIVRDNVSFRLNFTDEPGINEIEMPQTVSPSFNRIYESMILNYRDLRPEIVENVPEKIVMIYGNYTDQTFLNLVNQFALWKRQKGADVTVVSTATAGTSNTAIKTYLQNLYNNPSTRPDFVVLIGDVTGSFAVPTWTTNGAGDYPFTQLAGGDLLGDVFIGRISAENSAQLDVILSKVYAYEKNIDIPSAQWLNRMLLVGDSAQSGISVIYLQKYIREMSLLYNPDYTYTMLVQNSPSASAMNQAINQGVGFFDYRGYIGMSGWGPTESLINGNKLLHAVIITCSTGAFASTYGPATTESFIRLGTPAVPKGAVTAIGMDTSGTHTMPNNALCGAVFDGIFAQEMRSMGEALLYSKLYFSRMFATSAPDIVSSFTLWCNLMGDPTMEVYITIPHTFSTNAPATLPVGVNNTSFAVVDQDGLPVTNAAVTVTQNGTLISRAFTDMTGQVYLTLTNTLVAGSAVITVSKHDYKPLTQSITVPATGSLVAGMILVDDDNVGNSSGNGNSYANAGETLELLFGLGNTTSAAISNISGYVTCNSPYVTVVDSLVSYASVAPAELQFNATPVLMHIATGTPNNTMLNLTMYVTDSAASPYEITCLISVTDAILNFVSSLVVDGGNSALDPGETATLNVTITNNGTVPAMGIIAELFTDNDLVTVSDSLGFFGDVAVNSQASTLADNFIIHGRNLVLPGMIIPMRMRLTNESGFLQWVTFNLTVGVVTVHDPLGPDSYGYVIYDDADTDYTECPVFQWIGIAPAEGGTGTALNISDPDPSEEGDGDNATSLAVVTLPFTFSFYGQDYQQITVCSNGFLAMGVTENAEFRNYRLPGPMGPGGMIAPFWDDLCTAGGSGIYTYYDSSNHFFIIEWYQLVNGANGSSPETFQVILHDPAFYSTSMGDGPIKIQYQTFNNVDASTSNYNQGCYSTIGIESPDHTIGLEYSFNNQYPTAASPLGNQRALYITNIPIYYGNAYLVMGETVITDSNGNNVVEAGETVELGLQLLNIGSGQAENVNVTISSADPMVTITNSTSAYYPIAGDGTGFNQDAFVFNVSPDCPGNHSITFQVSIVSSTGSWQRSFTITVQSSLLTYDSFLINDIAGNNNGIADPNEDIMLIVNVKNNSEVDAIFLTGVLATTNSQVTIQNSVQIKPLLGPGDIIQFVFPVQTGNVANSTYIPFTFNVVADNAPAEDGIFTVGVGTSGVNLDFETSNGNFVSESGWVWGTPAQTAAHSGVMVWATGLSGQYPNNANFILKTPPIVIGSNAALSFWHLLDCEGSWDGGNISVSTNGGSSWTIVGPATGGSYIDNVYSLGEPGFSGGPASWTQVSFNLNQFANQEIIIMWHFGSDGSVQGNGWFIDDVMITGFSMKSGIVNGMVTLSNGADPSFARISSQNYYTTNPDSTGVYALYLPTGTYTVSASMPYYLGMSSPSITLTDQALTYTQDFVLIYLPAPADFALYCEQNQSLITLAWSAPVEPIYPVLTYKIYRRMGPGLFEMLGQVSTPGFVDNLTLDGHYYYYVRPVYSVGEGAPTETLEVDFPVVGNPEEPPVVLVNALNGNYPNPFNPATTISFSVAKAGNVDLRVYNTKGQLVRTLVSEAKKEGRHTIVWNGLDNNGKSVSSGMYLYRMQTGNFISTHKMMLIK
jgi:uncharacterized repeat protein (TIGR01451 family)